MFRPLATIVVVGAWLALFFWSMLSSSGLTAAAAQLP